MFDLQKTMKIGLLPLGGLIGIGIFSKVVGIVLPILNCILGLPTILINLGLLAWVGYSGAKNEKMDLVSCAISGAVVGAVSALVVQIVSFVLTMAGIGLSGDSGLGMVIGGAVGILQILFAPIIGAIMGAVLAALGAFVGGMQK